jgi:dolichol-phosphate mannosyltransferase
MQRLSIVVPVYNNAASLPELSAELRHVEEQLRARDMELELIIVDDGSKDDSLARILELKRERPATRVIKLTRNFGAMHASKTGLQHVTGDCFLFLAADLQDPPELILQMVERWLAGAKFIICVRQGRGDSLSSRAFAAAYYWLVRRIVIKDYPLRGYDLALLGGEFKTYLANSAKNINRPLYEYWLGFKPVEIPYVRRARKHGRSGWTLRKRVTLFIDSMVGFSIVPIRFVSAFGVLMALSSFSYGGLLAINTLRGLREVPGFATIVVLLTFLLGMVMATLGVMGEYLWRIYDEVCRKPEAVVEFVL